MTPRNGAPFAPRQGCGKPTLSGRLAMLIVVAMLATHVGVARAEEDEGKIAFNNHCRGCHSIKPGDNRLGPSMFAIVGARAGEVSGYRGYSGGLTGVMWDEATLDRFIADPMSVSPNTNMTSPPVLDAAERRKIIAFLKTLKSPSNPTE